MGLESYIARSPLSQAVRKEDWDAATALCWKHYQCNDDAENPYDQNGRLTAAEKILNEDCPWNPVASFAYSILAGHHKELLEENFALFSVGARMTANYFFGRNDFQIPFRYQGLLVDSQAFHAKASEHFRLASNLKKHFRFKSPLPVQRARHGHIEYYNWRLSDFDDRWLKEMFSDLQDAAKLPLIRKDVPGVMAVFNDISFRMREELHQPMYADMVEELTLNCLDNVYDPAQSHLPA